MLDKLSTQEDLDEVKAFLADKRLEHNKARLNQLFEQIELNIQWRRLNEHPIREWLEKWDDERRVIQRRRRHHKRHNRRHHSSPHDCIDYAMIHTDFSVSYLPCVDC
ncbi:hypothetical protein COOONC_27691 [Cooperia oncophora]